MECFPACVTCTGLCKQEPVDPSDRVWKAALSGSKRKKPYQYPHEPYIKLVCGHFTDATEQNVMRLLDTKHMLKIPRRKASDLFWCSTCGQWTDKYRYTPAELPEEPMF